MQVGNVIDIGHGSFQVCDGRFGLVESALAKEGHVSYGKLHFVLTAQFSSDD